jgi:EF-P beta-lysylation protein EpmB
MIPRTEPICQSETVEDWSWQQALANVIRSPDELFNILELDPAEFGDHSPSCKDFPLRVPHSFVARMEKGNWQDPLLKQVLVSPQELEFHPGFCKDPLQEIDQNPQPGIIHKYQGRALLIVSGACAIHCRYCFRRHFPYEDNNPGRQAWQQSLSYIANDPSITEIILSGGDPLSASNRSLTELVSAIAEIPHVKRLRVHTRLPIVIPQRIDDGCLGWLTSTRLQPIMVIHTNHANELDQPVADSLSKLKQAGITLLNQSVLLAGVNDDAKQLVRLSESLFDHGVLPYYLHLLDRVQGAAHFDVPEHRAMQLHQQLLAQLPGYLVPKLVRESAKVPFKLPIQANL